MADSFDAGDPAQVRERNRDLRVAEKSRKDMIAAIMGLPQGRAYFHELLAFCSVGHSPFASNALIMAHSCGQMNVGLKVQADLMGTVPDLYLQMLREADEYAKREPEASQADGSSLS
jgi:hypothetical protein